MRRHHDHVGLAFSAVWLPQLAVNIGFYPVTPSASGFTHEQSIAQVNFNGRTYRVTNDATVNLTYARADGQDPVDYHDMVWYLAQNLASLISTRVAVGNTGMSPAALTVGFGSDQPNGSVALGSFTVDPNNYVILNTPSDRWAYSSPRTVARMESLGDQWWKPGLVREGRSGQTIYLHTFPFDISGPTVAVAKQIIQDFTTIRFSYGEGFTTSDLINTVAQKFHAHFSTTNGTAFGLYPLPSPQNPDNSYLWFNADASGYVSGRIDFTVPVTAIDLDLMYFNSGLATMTAFDFTGAIVGQVEGTDWTPTYHLGITAPIGQSISYVLLAGNNGGVAINIKNLRLRALGPTLRFSYGEGFRDASTLNQVASTMNASFSFPIGTTGYGFYPPLTVQQPNDSLLFFNPNANGDVAARIDFSLSVSALALDICYFPNAPVTMRGYDNAGNVIAEASVPGATDSHSPNRIAITADPGNTKGIKYVVLTGNNGGGALNVKNLQMFTWN